MNGCLSRKPLRYRHRNLKLQSNIPKFARCQRHSWGMKSSFVRMNPMLATLDVPFTFTTAAPKLRCVGVAKMNPVDGQWRIWMLTTAADYLEEHSLHKLPRTNLGVIDTSQRGKAFAQGLPRVEGVLDAVVVGGSASGMANIVMLESISVNAIFCDLELVPGGSWSVSRYKAVQLHHLRNMIQLPMFPPAADEYREYLTGKDIGHYYARAVEEFKLPFFGDVKAMSNRWDKIQNVWETVLQDVRSGESSTIKTRNLVLSDGFLFGTSNVYVPELTDRETFKEPIQHTDAHRTAEPYRGKDVVIVGAGNSAHDIAKDLVTNGAKSVTILQRSPSVFIDFNMTGPVMSMMYQGQMLVEAADFL